jgi:hypothetical protein
MSKKPTKTAERAEQDSTLLNILKQRALNVQEKGAINQNRSFSLLAARDELFFQQLEAFTHDLFKKNPIKLKLSGFLSKKHNKPVKREVNAVLSDLHIRANLDPRELPHKYGWQEEARRLAKVVAEIADYKTQYRDSTHLNVNLIGDIIQGILDHDPRDGAPLAEQCGAAIHLLTQVLIFLAQHFPKVTVRCVPGNHGRNVARHKARAMHQKWDAFETIVYYSLKKAVAHLPNVSVEIPYSPHYIYESLGHYVMATHGDTFIDVGNPGSLINVKNINLKMNEINATRPKGQHVEMLAVGHVHVASRIRLPGGVVVITNGALIPPDGFMVNGVGRLDSVCSQTIWESTEKYVAGDYREITVDTSTDSDESLDKIITPFHAF